jgi:hypothetical protein
MLSNAWAAALLKCVWKLLVELFCTALPFVSGQAPADALRVGTAAVTGGVSSAAADVAREAEAAQELYPQVCLTARSFHQTARSLYQTDNMTVMSITILSWRVAHFCLLGLWLNGPFCHKPLLETTANSFLNIQQVHKQQHAPRPCWLPSSSPADSLVMMPVIQLHRFPYHELGDDISVLHWPLW